MVRVEPDVRARGSAGSYRDPYDERIHGDIPVRIRAFPVSPRGRSCTASATKAGASPITWHNARTSPVARWISTGPAPPRPGFGQRARANAPSCPRKNPGPRNGAADTGAFSFVSSAGRSRSHATPPLRSRCTKLAGSARLQPSVAAAPAASAMAIAASTTRHRVQRTLPLEQQSRSIGQLLTNMSDAAPGPRTSPCSSPGTRARTTSLRPRADE